jgi:RNA polymerase sigma-70 factor (ECF subfamily)
MARASDDASSEDRQTSGRFPTTRWSVISLARNGSEAALARLCEHYRAPVIAFLRAQGIADQDVEDVAHGFFATLLRRDFLRNVSHDRGRFRTWLARSLERYLRDHHASRQALKRGGGQITVSLQATDDRGRPLVEPVDPRPSPAEVFPLEWVKALVHRAWAQVERECAANHRQALLAELGPVLWHDRPAPRYREVAVRLGTTEGAVKMAAKRMRDRLAWLIRDQVKRTLLDETQVAVEIRELLDLFATRTPPARPDAGPQRDAAGREETGSAAEIL